MNKEKLYIEILKYGKENLDGFSAHGLSEHLQKLGFSNVNQHSIQVSNILKSDFHVIGGNPDHGTGTFALKSDGFFGLVNYQQLQESRRANNLAKIGIGIAIGISITTLIVEIWSCF